MDEARKPLENGEEDLEQRMAALRRTVKKSIVRGECGWEKLNDLAQQAFMAAVRALNQKEYRLFGLQLQIYSDIWQYACSHLNGKEYQYFCLYQAAPHKGNAM